MSPCHQKIPKRKTSMSYLTSRSKVPKRSHANFLVQVPETVKGKRKRKLEDNQPVDEKSETSDEEIVDEESRVARRLFVRNLPYRTSESDLIDFFSPYGDLVEVHLVADKKTKKSKGLAYVEFEEPTHAKEALTELDGSIFQGRLLHVLPSREKPQGRPQPSSEASHLSSYKQQREARLKEQSGKRVAWNTFYMRPDTIAAAVADHYGIPKGVLMNRDASDLGVRLALGEAHVIAQTKVSLEKAGVDVQKLEDAAQASGKASLHRSLPRSDGILILKNLPYDSNEAELMRMFEASGEVTRFVMPETKTMAVVKFRSPTDARRAFKTLAYKPYRSVPLYLEWAPLDLITSPNPTDKPFNEETVEGEDRDEEMGATLFVKNLSFSTTDAKLKEHFDGIASEIGGRLRSANVAKKKHANGSIVSSGFGFVEFDAVDVAQHVLNRLQGSTLDGHRLQLRFSNRRPKPTKRIECPETSIGNKLIVKNLAFECTKHDVVEVFRPYGQILRCRLPKKFDGQHRGFAFLEFVTKQQATAAMEAIGGVHLYGRRLNVEYAAEEETER